jgi:17beta-estradiol 17-dehydrogenase / very-long-chain 3-oxoacyl-CoA reductase
LANDDKWRVRVIKWLINCALVNNVGVNHSIPTPFVEEDEALIDSIVEVNIKGLMKMTKLVLPQMREK